MKIGYELEILIYIFVLIEYALKMEIQNILNIIGFIITTLSFAFGYYWYKQGKKKLRLFLRKVNSYVLVQDRVKNSNIVVQYKGEVVDNAVLFFKIELSNTGNIDLDESLIKSPIKIRLCPSYTLLEVQRSERSIDNMSLIHTGNDVILNFPLLKVGEKIIIDMFAKANAPLKELSNSDFIDEFLKCDYRIVNLKKIETQQRKERTLTNILINLFLVLSIIIMFFVLSFHFEGDQRIDFIIFSGIAPLGYIIFISILSITSKVKRRFNNKKIF